MQDIYREFFATHPPPSVTSLDFIEDDSIINICKINSFFDHAYVLNMEHKIDKWTKTENQLKSVGLVAERFIGYNGKQEPHYSEWQNYLRLPITLEELKKTKKKGIAFPGSWAILKSMKRMIIDAIHKNYKKILVLQDDILLHHDFSEKFIAINQSDQFTDWNLLYFGASQHNWNEINILGDFYIPHNTDGAFSVGIHRNCFYSLLKSIDKMCMPFDSGALCDIQDKFPRCFVIYPNIIIADLQNSDIRGSRNNQKQFHWDVKLYNK